MTRCVTFIILCFLLSPAEAQTSDSLMVQTLREQQIRFSDNNSVTLLMSGQQKFDDMFRAI